MIQAGILTEEDRVELMEGWIIEKVTHTPSHDVSIDLTTDALRKVLPTGWRVRVRSAVTTSDSELQPDLAVVRGPARRYSQSHPIPQDIALIVEVADTALELDRKCKSRLYARARLPVYWIVNLVDSQVEVYTDPQGGESPSYRQRRDYGIDVEVSLVIAGKQIAAIAVRELLP
ncbi:MAG: Uma2 family endonuclease [Gemmataceae bacterium]